MSAFKRWLLAGGSGVRIEVATEEFKIEELDIMPMAMTRYAGIASYYNGMMMNKFGSLGNTTPYVTMTGVMMNRE